jgi:hypothetical protein
LKTPGFGQSVCFWVLGIARVGWLIQQNRIPDRRRGAKGRGGEEEEECEGRDVVGEENPASADSEAVAMVQGVGYEFEDG